MEMIYSEETLAQEYKKNARCAPKDNLSLLFIFAALYLIHD